MCDVNDRLGEDCMLYRYNKEKTLNWLKNKVNRTATVLARQRKRDQLHNQTFSSTFVSANSKEVKPVDDVVLHEDRILALEIISEYLTKTTYQQLLDFSGISESDLVKKDDTSNKANKRKADWEIDLEIEKEMTAYNTHQHQRTEVRNADSNAPNLTTNSNTNTLKAKPPAAKTKAMEGAAKGTKSIFSFFNKK